MASRAKDATVLLIDIGRNMREVWDEASSKVTKADVALRMARNLAQQKLIFSPKHEVGVVFFGAGQTQNDLQADGYEHVFVCRDGKIDVPDLPTLRWLSVLPPGAEDSDAVNGLIVALDLLKKRTVGQKYTKTIWLLTDGASVLPGDQDLVECVKELDSTGTKICVALFGQCPTNAWSGLAVTKECIDLVPLATLAHQTSLCVKQVEVRAKVRLVLEISSDMRIPIGVFSKTTPARFPPLKKQSKFAGSAHGDGARIDGVKVERTFRLADEPDGDEIKPEDRIKGYKYGQSIVPMSEFDEAALTYTCDRTLQTLGFAPASSISPEHSMHHIEVVAADKGDVRAQCAFESLVEALLEEKRVLIARYSFRNNSAPRTVALLPQRGQDGEVSTMVMQYLPFAEDIRLWTCASLPEPSAEQLNVVSELVNMLSLEMMPSWSAGLASCSAASVEPIQELYRPEDTHNPSLTRFYSFLVARALDPAAAVPPAGPEAAVFERPAPLSERLAAGKAGQVSERLRAAFGLEKVEKAGKAGKAKRFWREAMAEKRKDLALSEVDTKRIKVESFVKKDEKEEPKVKEESSQGADGASASGMAAAVGLAPQVHIGSVNPERDFERWLARRDGGLDTVTPAIEKMCEIILRLAEEGEDFHAKALSCLTTLRRGCVQEGEAATYNEFVRRLARGGDSKRKAAFWDRARAAGLGLITDVEAPTSTVSREEARAFLAGEDFRSQPTDVGPSGASGAAPLSERELEAMIE